MKKLILFCIVWFCLTGNVYAFEKNQENIQLVSDEWVSISAEYYGKRVCIEGYYWIVTSRLKGVLQHSMNQMFKEKRYNGMVASVPIQCVYE